MNFVNLIVGGGAIVLCVVVPVAIWFFIYGLPEFLVDKMLWNKIDNSHKAEEEAENEEQKYLLELLERGVIAPAKILSVEALGQHRKRGDDAKSRVVYEVEVMPEGQPSFKGRFELWIPVAYSETSSKHSASKYEVFDAIEAEKADPKIWVVYEPNDPSQMTLHHRDKDHDLAMRMREFNRITKGNEYLKQTGESAEAIIIRVEDLDLPYPAKKSRAMRIEFDVMPTKGAKFQSEGNFLIGDGAIQKYSVGKKVYVRFDPQKPEKAVLDSERNKSLK